MTRGRKRRQVRRESRKLRKSGPAKAYYGGDESRLKDLRGDSDRDVGNARVDTLRASDNLSDEYKSAKSDAQASGYALDAAERRYAGSRGMLDGSIGQIADSGSSANATRDSALGSAMSDRNNALATGSLAGSADSVLAQRQAELAGKPTIGQATDTAVSAMGQAAQQRLGLAGGRINRQAMGLAGGMGEGGALAMQQAMASAGEGNRDALLDSNAQQNELGANMRFNAAQAQSQQDVDAANLGLSTRMTAAQAERANQMAVADANANSRLATGNANADTLMSAKLAEVQARQGLTNSDLSGQNAATQRVLASDQLRQSAAGAFGDFSMTNQGQALNNQQTIEGSQLGIDQAANQARYAAAVENSPLNKLKKVLSAGQTIKDIGNLGVPGFASGLVEGK